MEKQSILSYQLFEDNHYTKRVIYKNSNSNVFILNFLPGQQMPQHYHYGGELYFHVLKGNGNFQMDKSDLPVNKDDVIHCEGTTKLGFINTGTEEVSIFVTLSKIHEESAEINESC